MLLRSTPAAWAAVGVVFFGFFAAWGRAFFGPYPSILVAFAFVLSATSVFVFWKSGLLALVVWLVVVTILRDTPWTLNLAQWYAWPTWFATALIAGLALWGFRNVLGRQAAFPASRLDE